MSYYHQDGGYGQDSSYANYDLEEYGGQGIRLQPMDSANAPAPSYTPGAAVPQAQAQPVAAPRDPNAILNECRDIDEAVSRIDSYVDRITSLRQQFLAEIELSRERQLRAQADATSEELQSLYRNVLERTRMIKQTPGAGAQKNRRNIEKIQRKIERVIKKYQESDVEFCNSTKEQMMRQYRIVKPDAPDSEVQSQIENASHQDTQAIFSDALLQSDRRGEANKVSALVYRRRDDIRHIERELEALARTFQDFNALVLQQEFATEHIEQKAAEVSHNIEEGNTHVETAITDARKRNRKKWWCALIIVAIICVIVAVVLGATLGTK